VKVFLILVLPIIFCCCLTYCKSGRGSNYDYSHLRKSGVQGVVVAKYISRVTEVDVSDRNYNLIVGGDIVACDSTAENFIEIGDSIFKKANNDTFRIFRNGKPCIYLVPY
jgi:hypothetical protein